MTDRTRRYVPVAEVARPHGVRGELRLRVFNAGSDLLLRRPAVRLRCADGATRDATITGARAANKAILVTLAGVGDRDAADALRGAFVCVPRDTFPAAEEGEFYACDLEGAEVVMASGEAVGRVTWVQSYPTCDALVIDRGAAGTIEVPLVEAFVASVDLAVEREGGARVTLATLEGLP